MKLNYLQVVYCIIKKFVQFKTKRIYFIFMIKINIFLYYCLNFVINKHIIFLKIYI